MIIDLHTHITFDGFPQFLAGLGRKRFNANTLLKYMDKEGIDQSVVLPLANPENEGFFGVASNRETLRACLRHKDRLIPFCNIDPRAMLNTPKADLSRLLRVYRELGCRGIGEICANIPITDPRYFNLFHHAENLKMPLLFHITGNKKNVYGAIDRLGLPGLESALKQFPKTTFIGHAPFFWNAIDGGLTAGQCEGYPRGVINKQGALWTLLEQYPNLVGDLSAHSAYNAIIRDPGAGYRFLKRFYKQLCFGTDRFRPGGQIPGMLVFMRESLADGKLSRTQYDRIMFRNAQRILS